MNNAIELASVVKKFHRVEALKGLTLAVPQGAVYALVGPNGSGKTTAIKILMNIFGATAGHTEVLGIESTRLRGRNFEAIGYISENQEMPEWMTVATLLDFLRPFYPAWDKQLEAELLQQFNLPCDRKIRHLSRGMRMKAALVTSLAYHPRLIVLDEPFTGLDPLVRDELIQGLLARAEESTIFISSHDLSEIETFASHVAYLEEGKLQFAEELSRLANRFREVELSFDSPPSLPERAPINWLQLGAAASIVRFTDSCFDAERTPAEIEAAFGKPRSMIFSPMSLREIFLAIAKTGRSIT
jgi:ABC-2 type transport system ATP-binding protein